MRPLSQRNASGQNDTDSIPVSSEAILNTVSTRARTLLSSYDQSNPPDPALLFALPNQANSDATMFAFQKTYEGRWGVDIFFDAQDSPARLDCEWWLTVRALLSALLDGELTSTLRADASLSAALDASSFAYQQRFDSLFPQIASSFSGRQREFAHAITANLIGGIGHWSGPSIVDRSFSQEWDADSSGSAPAKSPQLTAPRELFSATPSRSFFPRGFYWDEGFHLALIGAWDNDLSLEIFRSWMSLADEDGWIAREQILGDEARSRVSQLTARAPVR